jgi:hypothetical protein
MYLKETMLAGMQCCSYFVVRERERGRESYIVWLDVILFPMPK